MYSRFSLTAGRLSKSAALSLAERRCSRNTDGVCTSQDQDVPAKQCATFLAISTDHFERTEIHAPQERPHFWRRKWQTGENVLAALPAGPAGPICKPLQP